MADIGKPSLHGLRVLDLSQVMAGPYCSMILGDLGAEIIKVEPPQGDSSRKTPPYFHKGDSAYYLSLNKNKKSIVINLKDERGLTLFYDLVKKSDVVFSNFRPGVLEKLRINHDVLKQHNEKIISCSISGFGHDSPYRERPALDLVVQAMGGTMSFTGEPGRPPVRMGLPMGDLGAGLFAVIGILSALNARNEFGIGQNIDISMQDCQIAMMTYRTQYYFLAGDIPKPVGSGHVSSVPIRAFKTKDDYLVIDSAGDLFWNKLCKALDMENLVGDSRFNSRKQRLRNKDQVMAILEEKFLEKRRKEWLDILLKEGVPCGPVNNVEEAVMDESVRHRKMIVTVNRLGDDLQMIGTPIKMSETNLVENIAPPTLGQDSIEILRDIFNYSEEKIDSLIHEGIVKKDSQ